MKIVINLIKLIYLYYYKKTNFKKIIKQTKIKLKFSKNNMKK